MVTKQIRIGSLRNIHQYDSGDYDKAMEVEDPISCTGNPTDPDDLAKISDLSDAVEDLVEGPASATDSNLAEFDGTTGKKIKDGSLSHADAADAISKKHDRQHALNSASDHTGTITDAQHGTRTQASAHAHSHLSGVGANDHHNQSHAATHVTGGGDTVADVIAAGNSGLMSGADKTKLDGVEALADVSFISKFFFAYDSTGNIDVTSGDTDITLDTEVKKDNCYTHSADSAEITITESGWYKIEIDVFAETTAGRDSAQWWIMIDTGGGYSEMAGTRAGTYHRTPGNDEATGTIHRLYEFSVDDKIKLQGAGDSGVFTAPDGVRFMITKVSS